jgi:hypothetical protein
MSGARKTDGNALAAGLRRAANDNGVVNIDPANPAPSTSHVYVPKPETPSTANQNEAMFTHVYVQTDKTCAVPHKTSADVLGKHTPLTVVTDLPERLPVLPQEVALIRAYLPALLARIAANDNEP